MQTFEKFYQIADREEMITAVIDLEKYVDWIIPDFPKEKYSDTNESKNENAYVYLKVVDNNTYNEMAKMLGYEPQKDKCILFDIQRGYMQKYDENGNYIGYEISYTSNYKDMNGLSWPYQYEKSAIKISSKLYAVTIFDTFILKTPPEKVFLLFRGGFLHHVNVLWFILHIRLYNS